LEVRSILDGFAHQKVCAVLVEASNVYALAPAREQRRALYRA
jgi:hypothetical protein